MGDYPARSYNLLRWNVWPCVVERASSDVFFTHQGFRNNMLFSSCSHCRRLPLKHRKMDEGYEANNQTNQADHFGVCLVACQWKIFGNSKGRVWLRTMRRLCTSKGMFIIADELSGYFEAWGGFSARLMWHFGVAKGQRLWQQHLRMRRHMR